MTTTAAPTNTPGSRRYITQLEPSEYVQGLFCISNTQLGRTKNDKPFLKVLVKDKTGEMAGRMWSIDRETYESLPAEGFAYLEGETQAYQGEMQIILRSIAPSEATIEQMRELLPVSANDPEKMFAEVVKLLGTLEHAGMKALAKVYLDDAALMAAFKQAPAAKSMHHAYIGGLLEHTLNLLRLADAVCPLYPKINRDIVMMGLFLHDLGKTRELVWDRAFSYSDRGELIGHLVEGAIMLHDRSQQVMRTAGIRLPKYAVTVLQHIIISHHDKPEFGAAKVPSTPEAILVAMLDNLDAKTFISLAATRPEREAPVGNLGGNFTEKQWALDTKLFKPDPLKE
ncbi:MAG: HD domain-containing protein [Phycisphaerales bacterium]|nr:HD domain-containing protein [Phycisphaerales bacterium]